MEIDCKEKFKINIVSDIWTAPNSIKDGDIVSAKFYCTIKNRFYLQKDDNDCWIWIDQSDIDSGFADLVE